MIEPRPAISPTTFRRWLSLGLPGTVLWGIGGVGALRLLNGLVSGAVTPGVGSTTTGLSIMWGAVVVCAVAGVVLGSSSLILRIKRELLATNVLAGFGSLFFSVLTSS